PVEVLKVMADAKILPRPLSLPADRWYQLLMGGININEYLPFGFQSNDIVAMSQQARLLVMGVLPKDIVNTIIMPYLYCPQKPKLEEALAESDFAEVERLWLETLP